MKTINDNGPEQPAATTAKKEPATFTQTVRDPNHGNLVNSEKEFKPVEKEKK